MWAVGAQGKRGGLHLHHDLLAGFLGGMFLFGGTLRPAGHGGSCCSRFAQVSYMRDLADKWHGGTLSDQLLLGVA